MISMYKIDERNFLNLFTIAMVCLSYFHECVSSLSYTSTTMPDRQTPKLILLLVVAAFINEIKTFDVWSYWRERTGEKARVWKKAEEGVLPCF